MIIQQRERSLWFIEQNDHALISGEFARHWCGLTGSGVLLPIDTQVAIALHDAAWLDMDASPRTGPGRNIPHDFLSLPDVIKSPLYTRGIDKLEAVNPYGALLVSLHYSAFIPEADRVFHERELERQRILRSQFAGRLNGPRLDDDYAMLKFLDVMSLRLCMTVPGSDEHSWPSWLMNLTWAGRGLRFSWDGPHVVEVEPFPFIQPIELSMPYRELPRRLGMDRESWRQEFAQSPIQWWPFRIDRA